MARKSNRKQNTPTGTIPTFSIHAPNRMRTQSIVQVSSKHAYRLAQAEMRKNNRKAMTQNPTVEPENNWLIEKIIRNLS